MVSLKPADIFGDHMVLQRGKKICVFGEGEGEGSISLNGKETAFTADGEFRAYLPAEEAGGPYDMTVRLGTEEIVFTDILIGDVFLAGGQSNMEFPLLSTENFRAELEDAENVRYFQEPHSIDVERVITYKNHGWMKFTVKHEPAFSAIAYFFAMKYHKDTGIPVGIVSCNKGASRVDAWTAPEIVESADYQEMIKVHHCDMELYRFNIGQMLYMHKLLPIVPYTIAGVLWYQGESNRCFEEGLHYDAMFRIMTENWRALWQDELPFYTVQIMPFDEPEEKADWSEVRFAELRAARDIPGVKLVTLFDTGEEKEIHPTRKKCVGEALAKAVLSDAGGTEEYTGPLPAAVSFLNDHVEVRFDHAEGLEIRGGSLRDTYMTVLSADGSRERVPAAGEVQGNLLILKASKEGCPLGVEMGHANVPRHNLYNAAGYLASPFSEKRIR